MRDDTVQYKLPVSFPQDPPAQIGHSFAPYGPISGNMTGVGKPQGSGAHKRDAGG